MLSANMPGLVSALDFFLIFKKVMFESVFVFRRSVVNHSPIRLFYFTPCLKKFVQPGKYFAGFC